MSCKTLHYIYVYAFCYACKIAWWVPIIIIPTHDQFFDSTLIIYTFKFMIMKHPKQKLISITDI